MCLLDILVAWGGPLDTSDAKVSLLAPQLGAQSVLVLTARTQPTILYPIHIECQPKWVTTVPP